MLTSKRRARLLHATAHKRWAVTGVSPVGLPHPGREEYRTGNTLGSSYRAFAAGEDRAAISLVLPI
jgi:hypothetical protein